MHGKDVAATDTVRTHTLVSAGIPLSGRHRGTDQRAAPPLWPGPLPRSWCGRAGTLGGLGYRDSQPGENRPHGGGPVHSDQGESSLRSWVRVASGSTPHRFQLVQNDQAPSHSGLTHHFAPETSVSLRRAQDGLVKRLVWWQVPHQSFARCHRRRDRGGSDPLTDASQRAERGKAYAADRFLERFPIRCTGSASVSFGDSHLPVTCAVHASENRYKRAPLATRVEKVRNA